MIYFLDFVHCLSPFRCILWYQSKLEKICVRIYPDSHRRFSYKRPESRKVLPESVFRILVYLNYLNRTV